jgi:hypothetical protein
VLCGLNATRRLAVITCIQKLQVNLTHAILTAFCGISSKKHKNFLLQSFCMCFKIMLAGDLCLSKARDLRFNLIYITPKNTWYLITKNKKAKIPKNFTLIKCVICQIKARNLGYNFAYITPEDARYLVNKNSKNKKFKHFCSFLHVEKKSKIYFSNPQKTSS